MSALRTRPLLSTLAAGLASLCTATACLAQISFYENESFGGRSFTANNSVPHFGRQGFNNRASSVVVTGNRWELCEEVRFRGRCTVVRPGQYPSLAAMGLGDRVSSARVVERHARVDERRYAPPPVVQGDYRRRRQERLYEARVTAVHAVLGTPEQRCWVERERVSEGGGDARVPGAIFGAVIGGILGHQLGSGSGRGLATAGGVVAGAAVGSEIGRNQPGAVVSSREVQRCAEVPGSARPEYWDVAYEFRGKLHHVQLTRPPGPTITVNRRGEPRA